MKMELSIVIITFNTRDVLHTAIETILTDVKCLPHENEMIVVDNSSNDGTQEMIRAEFPVVQLIANDRNLGAAVGRNQGIEASKGKYVLLLDSDTFIQSSAIAVMLDFIKQTSDCGYVGCKLLNADGSLHTTWKVIAPNTFF